jgi:DNA-binding NtrC family response regulator
MAIRRKIVEVPDRPLVYSPLTPEYLEPEPEVIEIEDIPDLQEFMDRDTFEQVRKTSNRIEKLHQAKEARRVKIPSYDAQLYDCQRQFITDAVAKAHGNIAAAASNLGIDRKTIYRIIERSRPIS